MRAWPHPERVGRFLRMEQSVSWLKAEAVGRFLRFEQAVGCVVGGTAQVRAWLDAETLSAFLRCEQSAGGGRTRASARVPRGRRRRWLSTE